MKKFKYILPLLFTAVAMDAGAQQISIDKSTINCGQILFKQPVTAQYIMKNSGDKPLIINDVRTSCGCTTASYPHEPIPAGKSFTVSVVYDAKTLGHFNKEVGIYSNAGDTPLMLKINGIVVGEKSLSDEAYRFKIGDLDADLNDIEFDDVNRGDQPVQVIHVRNNADQTVEPVVMHLPNFLRATVKPTKILPQHDGTISIKLDSRSLRDLGLTQTSIYLGMFPGDKVAPEKEITVSTVLLPAFENMTATQKANAPKMRLSEGSFELGRFEGKKRKKGTIRITNEGRTTLEIRSLQMFTTGLEVSLNNAKIEPGGKADLKVTAIADLLKKARSKPRILLITNDPENTKVTLNVNIKP